MTRIHSLGRRVALAAAVAVALVPLASQADPQRHAKHVVLISVDGLHQADLDWYVAMHGDSTLATMVRHGVAYTNARTPFPSDSFPGLVAQVTGGNPKSTGIYYDDAYSRALLFPPYPAAKPDCTQAPGAEVQYAENVDIDLTSIGAGQPGLDLGKYTYADIKAKIYALSSKATDLIDPRNLPWDPKTCTPVYPHQYLKVNTVFEVARRHGLHTAWSDKHAAYDIVGGPSGRGVEEFFTPEINSNAAKDSPNGGDWTKDNLDTQFYDALKVEAVLRWAHGRHHDGSSNLAGVPAIYGMNFQAVSTAQKLNTSRFRGGSGTGLGGYSSAGQIPDQVLAGALDFVDAQMARIVTAAGDDSVVILSAKHGQSPQSRADLTIINDGDMLAALETAWAKAGHAGPLVAHPMDDDGVLLWLNDRSAQALKFTKDFLWSYAGTGIGSDAAGNKTSRPFANAGLKAIHVGEEAAQFMGVRKSDDRVPDVIGIAKQGSVYAGSKLSKIAEHGGNAAQDRHVPIVVWGAGVEHQSIDDRVETTQIAPTILKVLGLPAHELKAVRSEGTEVLPDLDR
jgi:hypothetical protein